MLKKMILGSVLCLLNVNTYSVELIQVPQGVIIRAIPSFDHTKELKAYIHNKSIKTVYKNNTIEAFIPKKDYCNHPRYYAIQEYQLPKNINLDYLCLKNTSNIRIIFITDTQKYHNYHEKAAQYIRDNILSNFDIRLIINGGDLVQTSLLKEWIPYRQIASKYYSSKIPLIPVVGNHDYRQDPELYNFKFFYGSQSTDKTYYMITLENLHIIVLNSNYKSLTSKELKDQEQWLKNTLESINQQNPVIITFHHPPYGSLFYVDLLSWARVYMLKQIMPIIYKYPNVKLLLNGHTHIFERLKINNINILIGGAVGGELLPFYLYNFSKQPKFRSIQRTLSILNYDKQKLKLNVQSIDFLQNQIIDEFTINY